jgi:hypothetical protein
MHATMPVGVLRQSGDRVLGWQCMHRQEGKGMTRTCHLPPAKSGAYAKHALTANKTRDKTARALAVYNVHSCMLHVTVKGPTTFRMPAQQRHNRRHTATTSTFNRVALVASYGMYSHWVAQPHPTLNNYHHHHHHHHTPGSHLAW